MTKNKAYIGAPVKLPPANPDHWKWQDDAGCIDADVNLFFYADSERGEEKFARIQYAKAFCSMCSVKQQCLEWANAIGETHGIWGGLTPEERGVRFSKTKN